MPGDEFIVDCWTDSRDRTEHTTGGESSSQEMCFVFLFYYPAMPFISTIGGKTPEALGTWMYDAQQAGYLSGDYNDLFAAFNTSGWGDQNFTGFEYYSEKDGALEFYNRLYNASYDSYNSHYVSCWTQQEQINENSSWMIPRNENFTHYELYDLECENIIDVDSDDIGVCVETLPTDDATALILMINGLIVLITSIF